MRIRHRQASFQRLCRYLPGTGCYLAHRGKRTVSDEVAASRGEGHCKGNAKAKTAPISAIARRSSASERKTRNTTGSLAIHVLFSKARTWRCRCISAENGASVSWRCVDEEMDFQSLDGPSRNNIEPVGDKISNHGPGCSS